MQNITIPDSHFKLDRADEDDIVSFIQEVERWRSDVLTIPYSIGEWTITEEQKQIMYTHLGEMFSDQLIDNYFNRHYSKESERYRIQEIDVAIVHSEWDEYHATVEPLGNEQMKLKIVAISNSEGMRTTHESTVQYDKGKIFFESFSTRPN